MYKRTARLSTGWFLKTAILDYFKKNQDKIKASTEYINPS